MLHMLPIVHTSILCTQGVLPFTTHKFTPLDPPTPPPRLPAPLSTAHVQYLSRPRPRAPPSPSPPARARTMWKRRLTAVAAVLLASSATLLLTELAPRVAPRVPGSSVPGGAASAASSGARRCFIYDRPPRTASTTAATALKLCLYARGFAQPAVASRAARALVVRRMLSLGSARVGVFSRHVQLGAGDARRVRAGCAALVYVSGCRPMRARLWSAAKYAVAGRGNATVGGAARRRAEALVEGDGWVEAMYEAYPYVDGDGQPNGTPGAERLVPDYVVRAGSLEKDLGGLLGAMGCAERFRSDNVHEEEGADGFLDGVRLEHGDATYRRLERLAREGNERGLQKIRDFMAAAE